MRVNTWPAERIELGHRRYREPLLTLITVRLVCGAGAVRGSVFLLALMSMVTLSSARAEQYCANYRDGTQQCGIPTWESCEQSLSGVGGSCGIDNTSQLPENLLQRLRDRQDAEMNAQPDSSDVPPPPDE